MISAFGIAGGDLRQIYLARALANDGCRVYLSCLENAPGREGFPQVGLSLLAEKCEAVLLPLPATRDGLYLNTPLSNMEIRLDDSFARMFGGRRVFGGMMAKLVASSSLWQQVRYGDYYAREELVAGNAYLTAEGAVALAVQEHPGTLGGARCLVTGYGRIGKALCGMLRGMGAQVFCGARKDSDLTCIRAAGYQPLRYGEIARPFDLIFNTVPARVIGEEALACQSQDALAVELASAPGGIDLEAAEAAGVRVLLAPSLPGRMSPKASGELIQEAVYHMLREE